MERINKLTGIVSQDKGLLGLLSGLVFSIIGLLSVAAAACVWYL